MEESVKAVMSDPWLKLGAHGTIAYNPATGHWTCTPAIAALLGLADQTPLTTEAWLALVPDTERDVWQTLMQWANTPQDYQGPVLASLLREGRAIPLLVTPHASAAGAQFSVLDLTSVQNRLTQLETRKVRLRQVVASMRAGTWDWDIPTGSMVVSKMYLDIMGIPHDGSDYHELSIDQFYDSLHDDERARVLKVVDQFLHSGEPYRMELRMRRADGQFVWVEDTGISTLVEAKPVRMVGSIVDISERKAVEARLARHDFLLAEAGRQGRIGCWEVDVLQGTISWTEETYRIHEVDPAEFTPDPVSFLSFYDAASRARLEYVGERCLLHAEPYDVELEITTGKGNHAWTRAKATPITNENGQVVMVVGTYQEITEQKQRELALQRSMSLVGDQNKRLMNFAHIVSHNLRSHTGNLQMLADLVMVAEDEAERNEMLSLIKTTSSKLNDTISELNEIVRIQNHISEARSNIDLAQVIEDLLLVLSPQIEQSGATIDVQLPGRPVIHYVPAYLESILLNLLTNAIKYAHPRRAPHVTVTAAIDGDRPVITVTDNGLGIDLERYGDKLFGMYKTFHDRKDSRGVGLFITKSQIEALGGRIEVTSTVGEGSTFTAYL